MCLVERQLEFAVIGDPTGVGDGPGKFCKRRRDFFGRLHIELVGIELHSGRIAQRLARLEAEHELMRSGILLLQVMTVVGAGERDAEFLMDFYETRIGDSLMLEAVRLYFEIEVLFPEELLKFARDRHGAGHVLLPDQVWNLPAQAP